MKFFFALVFLFGCFIHNSNGQYSIQYIDTDIGLSQNEVTCIIQDKYGFMWFGTRGGLNRYDGYEFKHYKPGRDEQNSLNNPSIERLYTDKEGNIWIGTKSGGYNIYNISKEKFYSHKFDDRVSNRIISFMEGLDSTMWIGGWTGGLWEYNKKAGSIEHWLGDSRINSLVISPDSTMWCGTNNGLRYAKEGEAFKSIDLIPGYNEITEIVFDKSNDSSMWLVGWELNLVHFNYKDLSFTQYRLPWDKNNMSPKAYSLMQDSNGILWLGTWGDGLFRFDTQTKQFEQINIKPPTISGTTIDYDVILDIYEDVEGSIWIGTDGGGVVRLYSKSKFKTLNELIKNDIRERHVNAVLLDSSNRLWLGTKGDGVFVSDQENGLTKVGFLKSDRLYNKKGIIAKNIYQDSEGTIWISINEGLYIVKEKTDGSIYLKSASLEYRSPDFRYVEKAHDILIHKDELWVSTQQMGLFLFKKDGSKFKLEKQFLAGVDKGQLSINRITSLLIDNEERMWVGTYKGLFQFQPSDSTFVSSHELIKGEKTPLCDIILSTWLDRDNNLWFGTPCSLNKLIKNEDGNYYLKDYSRSDGLSDDYVNAILDDEQGNIWLSTNAGVSKLDIANETFRNFDVTDGVGGSNFSESACCKGKDGTLYFGGFSDLTYFHPDSIIANKVSPPIVITDFKILNKSLEVADDGILAKTINEQESITLSHKESEFSLELAALDFDAPQQNLYAYWLEGSGEGIINTGTRRHITFSNLKPGEYVLHLKGTNSNGFWSDKERTLAIEILPAPWRTWYAILLYVIVILVIVALITSFTRKQEQLANEAQIEKVLREKEHQINEYKFKFFTNISHEIRTPLTLIMAPINELLQKDISTVSASFIINKIKMVQQHSNRLFNLVNQLLEFRKVEAGKISLQVSKYDIVEYVIMCCKSFDELTSNRKIAFRKKFNVKEPEIYFDIERLGVVFNNLLSNAFKFAGEPGEVEVELSDTPTDVCVRITNNGQGIKSNDLEHLFERFYQVHGVQSVASSGIGLALVKTYVDLHNGKINVVSEIGKLTTFTVTLQKGRAHLSESVFISDKEDLKNVIVPTTIHNIGRSRTLNVGTKGATILLVEDNSEVRDYLTELLSEEYNTLEAIDGVEGYDKVIEHKPHLVISDVMMPRMDGFELCQKIKSNDTIAHIPVLLLTAKGTTQDQLFGTRKGADIYLTKPFDPKLLIEKAKQLISSRKKLSEKFSQTVVLEPTDAVIESEDGIFLEQAIKTIEKFMGDSSFDPEKLASELAMSSSTFYRKIKKLTQKSSGEFIKHIRLKRSAQLLKETQLTVSEIIESVGYQDIKNFRRNFKQEYNITPSEFRKSERETSMDK